MMAGREMDLLMAEKLGWSEITEALYPGMLWALPPGYSRPASGSAENHVPLPKFSTNLSDAWQIWESLPEVWEGLSVSWRLDRLSSKEAEVAIGWPAGEDAWCWITWGRGAPAFAICQAALAALGYSSRNL